MERVLAGLEPERVFYYFEEISRIPRCSGDEKRISDYLVEFGKKNNLTTIQDEALNVIIKKEGTKGYENTPTVVLQGHMDMVCEKEANVDHDFSKDPIKLRVNGDSLEATGTTLGADNGIAVAMCLAILESKSLQHPPLEVLVTTSEETGMNGAQELNPQNIDGRILINIDSEEEGQLLVSCAGGGRNRIRIPIEWENIDKNMISYKIELQGLNGGHSGIEINKQRGNANKLMGRVLYELSSNMNYKIYSINGGSKTNAIPRSAEALVVLDKGEESQLMDSVLRIQNQLKNEYRVTDPDVSISVEKGEGTVEKVFSSNTLKKIIATLMLIPNGVQSMSKDIEGLVESSNNIGVVTTMEDEITFESAVRSSVGSIKKNILNQMDILAEILGVKSEGYSAYPEWQYDPNSYIRTVFQKVYKEKYGVEPEITAIHAGLECGLFKEKFNDMDMVSFGPNMHGVHTTSENLSIASTKRTWELLVDVLKEIK